MNARRMRVNLLAVGDVGLRCDSGANPLLLLREIAEPDAVVFANLETALAVSADATVKKAVSLCVPPERARWLSEANVDVVSVANNHVLDAGEAGLRSTLDVLERCGIASIGAGDDTYPDSTAVIVRDGFRVGWLGYCEAAYTASTGTLFINGCDEESVCHEVRTMRRGCDVVIVSLHMGVEDAAYPSPAQVSLSRRIIDAGASAVLTHHSHTVQGMEIYKHGVIAYSLGNFQFPGDGETRRRSFALSLCLTREGVETCEIIPIRMDDSRTPRIPDSETAAAIRERVAGLSGPIVENRITWSWWYANIANPYLSGNLRAWWVRMRRYGIRHVFQCARWAVSSFVLHCFVGLFRADLREEMK